MTDRLNALEARVEQLARQNRRLRGATLAGLALFGVAVLSGGKKGGDEEEPGGRTVKAARFEVVGESGTVAAALAADGNGAALSFGTGAKLAWDGSTATLQLGPDEGGATITYAPAGPSLVLYGDRADLRVVSSTGNDSLVFTQSQTQPTLELMGAEGRTIVAAGTKTRMFDGRGNTVTK